MRSHPQETAYGRGSGISLHFHMSRYSLLLTPPRPSPQPPQNVKTILSSGAAEKQALGQIWPMSCGLPSPGLKHPVSPQFGEWLPRGLGRWVGWRVAVCCRWGGLPPGETEELGPPRGPPRLPSLGEEELLVLPGTGWHAVAQISPPGGRNQGQDETLGQKVGIPRTSAVASGLSVRFQLAEL